VPSWSLVAALAISTEIAMDAPVRAPGDGAMEALSAHGDGHLLVWSAHGRLRVSPVDTAGVALAPAAGLPALADGTDQADAVAAFGAGAHLVVWREGAALRAARVAPDGSVLDAEPLGVADDAAPVAPRVAWDGAVFRVAWVELGGARLRVARVAPGGALLDTVPLDAGRAAVGAGAVVLGCLPGTCLAWWSADPWASLVPDPASGTFLYVELVADTVGGGGHVWVRRVSATGEVLDAPGLRLSGPFADRPRGVHDGTSWLVAWDEARGSPIAPRAGWAARIDAAGVSLDPLGGFVLPMLPGAGPGACAGGACLLVSDAGGLVVRGGAADAAGPRPLAVAGNTQREPGLAAGTGGALAVWQDRRDDAAGDVWSVPLDATGAPRGAPAPIERAPGAAGAAAPAWTGDAWLVVWLDQGHDPRLPVRVRAARVAPDGTPGPAVVAVDAIAAAPSGLALACGGAGGCLAAWGGSGRVRAAHLDALGRAREPGGFAVAPVPAQDVAATALPDGHVVAWVTVEGEPGVHAARLDASGAVTRLTRVAAGDAGDVAVASDGGELLVVWSASVIHGDAASWEVRAARLALDGRAIDGEDELIVVAGGLAGAGAPAVVWDGRAFVIAWRQGDALRLARVSQGGVALDPGGVALAPGAAPALAPGGEGAVLAAYERLDATPAVSATRVRARLVSGDDAVLDGDGAPWADCACRAGHAGRGDAPPRALSALALLALAAAGWRCRRRP
jgi:hypothetical protein